jgi:hypothetical protein
MIRAIDYAGHMPRSVSRRSFIESAISSIIFASTRARASGGDDKHICVAETYEYTLAEIEAIKSRFDVFKKCDVDFVRCGMSWMDFEAIPGQWSPPRNAVYLRTASAYGLKVKALLASMEWPPRWFLDRYSQALLRDQQGDIVPNLISYWFPNLDEVLDESLDGMIKTIVGSGLAETIDSIIVELGAAAEPIYPPSGYVRSQGTKNPITFWFYDQFARVHFRDSMRTRYAENLNALNHAWSSNFKFWEEIAPSSGQCNAKRWLDVLEWYRDTKRQFVLRQIVRYRAMLNHYKMEHIALIVLVPGKHLTAREWSSALESCDGDIHVKVMTDTQFLIDAAVGNGCHVQDTGGEDEDEIGFQRRLVDAKHMGWPMWVETTSFPQNFERIAERAALEGCWGLELVDSRKLFSKGNGGGADEIRVAQFQSAVELFRGDR